MMPSSNAKKTAQQPSWRVRVIAWKALRTMLFSASSGCGARSTKRSLRLSGMSSRTSSLYASLLIIFFSLLVPWLLLDAFCFGPLFSLEFPSSSGTSCGIFLSDLLEICLPSALRSTKSGRDMHCAHRARRWNLSKVMPRISRRLHKPGHEMPGAPSKATSSTAALTNEASIADPGVPLTSWPWVLLPQLLPSHEVLHGREAHAPRAGKRN
mmetsp:Transcript_134128/g.233052  ORF Transcript_134128/g.233052 Transcript_134128/m.233052 type:complete len:211 (-) Transcript_134128:6-638(-)